MPNTPLLTRHLTDDKLSTKGKFLAVELVIDHQQDRCTTVPRGTRGIITAGPAVDRRYVFLFPNSVLGEEKLFSDGDIRIIAAHEFKAIGRIDHK